MSDRALVRWHRSVAVWATMMFGLWIGAWLWAGRGTVFVTTALWVLGVGAAWWLDWLIERRLDDDVDTLGSYLDQVVDEGDELALERRIRQVDNLKRTMVSFLDDPLATPGQKASMLGEIEELDRVHAELIAQRDQ